MESATNNDLPKHNPRARVVLAAIVLLLVSAIGGGIYWFQIVTRTHLILGVPYWGSTRGTEISSPGAFAVYSLLQYWGDGRFGIHEIASQFPVRRPSNPTVGRVSEIASFFKNNGYEVETLTAETIRDLQKTIDKDIPVIITQRTASDAPPFLATVRIIIGYSNNDKTVTTHDNIFGNNYEISYDEFDLLNDGSGIAFIITPAPSTEQTLRGPDRELMYPERLGIMDSPSIRRSRINWLTIGALNLNFDGTEEHTKEIVGLWEEIISDESFVEFHPAAQVEATFNLARLYVFKLEEHQRAVEILTRITPLLDLDWNQPYGEWERAQSEDIYQGRWYYANPMLLLGAAYLKLDREEEASQAFQEAERLFPGNQISRDYTEGKVDADTIDSYRIFQVKQAE